MKKAIAALSLLVLCLPFTGLAHPGHGEAGGYTITHYFTEPVHLVISLAVIIAAVFYIRYLVKNRHLHQIS